MATTNALMPVLKHFTTLMGSTTDAAQNLVAVSVEPEFNVKREYLLVDSQT
jgi:hypothetical protein